MKALVKSLFRKSMFVHIIINRILFFLRKRLSGYSLDKSNYIDKSVHYIGLRNIKMGLNNVVSEGVWFNVNKRREGLVGIEIGSNCYIGKRNFFSSGNKIIIGDFLMSGINCSFLGSDHVFDGPYEPYMFTGTTEDSTITIGDNVWLGANVTILGDVHIGRGSIVGANSLVNRDIPPFSLAVGNPARVIKRFDFSNKTWTADFSELEFFLSEAEYKKELSLYRNRTLSAFPSGKNFGDLF